MPVVVNPSKSGSKSVVVLPLLLIAEFPNNNSKSIPVWPIESPAGLFDIVGALDKRLRVKTPLIVPKVGLNNGVIVEALSAFL